jgi:F-type H+-transporting ATPase subunit beta
MNQTIDVAGGRVIAVRGAIVDVAFDSSALPLIEESISIMSDQGSPIVAEVQAHLDESTVRALVLQSTNGLQRGTPVRPSGGPIQVPVGEAMLGRLIDVTGTPGDRGARSITRRRRSPLRALPPTSSGPGSR